MEARARQLPFNFYTGGVLAPRPAMYFVSANISIIPLNNLLNKQRKETFSARNAESFCRSKLK